MSAARDLVGPPLWRRPMSAAADWLIVALVSPLVLLERVDLRRAVLALILIEIPIQLDKSFAIRSDVAASNGIGGFNISLTTALLGVLYVLWAFDLFRGRSAIDKSRISASVPMLLYLGALVLSALLAYDRVLALYEIDLVLTAMLLGAYVGLNLNTADDVVFVVSCIAVGVLLQAILVIGLRVIGESLVVATVKLRIDPSGRVGGTVGSPNSAGSYFTTLVPLCLALASARLKTPIRLLAGSAAFLGVIALVFTRSRGAWLGFLAAGIVLTLAALAWNRVLVKRLAPIAAVVVLGALPFSGEIASRFQRDDRGAAEARMPLMRLASKIALAHPIVGVGPNNFVPVMPEYVTVDFSGAWLQVVHSKYFLVWSETGTVGLVAFVLALAAALRLSFRSARAQIPILSPLAAGLGAGLLGHMVHMTVDIFNHRPHIMFLWLIIGVIVGVHALVKRQEKRRAMTFAFEPALGSRHGAW